MGRSEFNKNLGLCMARYPGLFAVVALGVGAAVGRRSWVVSQSVSRSESRTSERGEARGEPRSQPPRGPRSGLLARIAAPSIATLQAMFFDRLISMAVERLDGARSHTIDREA